MLRRLLASAVVRIPFFTRRSTKVGLITAAVPTLAPLFVAAALVAALVGSAAVVALESAAISATGTKRHATASRHTIDDRKQSRIFASKQVGAIQYQPGKPGVMGIPDR
jgi:streptogramin lyase